MSVIILLMFVLVFGVLGSALSYGAILIFRGLGNRPARTASTVRPAYRRPDNYVSPDYKG